MRSLLDVNVLIALLDATHTFHQAAHAWWATAFDKGWASCPLVENGVTRIMSHPNYSVSRRFSAGEIVKALSEFATSTDHEFWPDSLTLIDDDVFATDRMHSSKQITDLYLLALAAKNEGRLVTFDQGIAVSAVKNARVRNLKVI